MSTIVSQLPISCPELYSSKFQTNTNSVLDSALFVRAGFYAQMLIEPSICCQGIANVFPPASPSLGQLSSVISMSKALPFSVSEHHHLRLRTSNISKSQGQHTHVLQFRSSPINRRTTAKDFYTHTSQVSSMFSKSKREGFCTTYQCPSRHFTTIDSETSRRQAPSP